MHHSGPFEVKVDIGSIEQTSYASGPVGFDMPSGVDRAIEEGLVSAHDVVDALNASWSAGVDGTFFAEAQSTSNIIAEDMTWISTSIDLPHDVRVAAETDGEFGRAMAAAMSASAEAAVPPPGGLLSQAASVGPSSGTASRGPAMEPVPDHVSRSKDVGR